MYLIATSTYISLVWQTLRTAAPELFMDITINHELEATQFTIKELIDR